MRAEGSITRRDTLAALMFRVLADGPSCTLQEQAHRAASVALTFAHLEHRSCDLLRRHGANREAALTRALAAALERLLQVDPQAARDVAAALEDGAR